MLRIPRAIALGLLVAGCRTQDGLAGVVAGDAARGFELVRERGCTSCHALAGLAPEPAPRLEHVGARLTPAALEAALATGPRMPDCLAGLGKGERAMARSELTHFLASLGGPLAPEPASIDALTIERGRQLYHAVGCVACHAPFEAASTLERPLWDFTEAYEPAVAETHAPAAAPRDPRELRGIGARTTPGALARYLRDPLAFHPAGRMPSLALGAGEAADLAAYLCYEDALDEGAVLAPGPGLLLDYYEADFAGETADFDALAPVRSEVAASFFDGIARREEDFGFRFRGLLEIAAAGQYRFFTNSDDGSMLYVDGKLVVDNRGQHGMDEQEGELHLGPGRHAFELSYFEHFGGEGLEVSWAGPGFEKRALGFEGLSHLEARIVPAAGEPFVLDPELVERGRERYEALGCANCHTRCGEGSNPFVTLDPVRGCLARKPRGVAPRYRFAPGEREDLLAAVRAGTPPARTAAERLQAELARLDCGACHARDALSGPPDERRSYFQVAGGLDLGDEGRLPPSLERVGAKLKPGWFHAVLEQGGRARPYMKTRMPQFGAANVAELPELFAAVDARLRDEREPEFASEAVEAGKQLAGTKGLGCIQCHELAGHPSIGIPAVDLAKVHERIYPGWFRELLLDPVALKMNTRMPAFWVDGKSPVKDLYDADPVRQIDALWSYLALGSSMPLPYGLVPLEGEYEVEVYDTPVCVGVFMAGVSPRTIAVGLPERVHYAFDVQNSRLALAWRGRFLDVRGTWYARAGQLEKPAGEDVLEFPRGPLVAMLEHPDDPWPTEYSEQAGYRTLGRALDDARRPVFRYQVGHVVVSETVVPEVRPGRAVLHRRLHFQSPDLQSVRVDLLVAAGSRVQHEPVSGGSWVIAGEREVRVRIEPKGWRERVHVVVGVDGREELRLRGPVGVRTTVGNPILEEEPNQLEVEYSW